MAATTSRMPRWRFDADNKMIAFKVDTIANFGAYMSLFSSCVPTYLYATLLSGQYAIPAIHANVRAVYTNTSPVDAYRGAGRPEATYLLERIVETAARELGVSPAELRRKNFITEFPYQTPVIMAYDAGGYEASLDAAMKAADYAGFGKRKAEAEKRGKLRGIGMSCYIEACGIAPSAGGRLARRRRGLVGIGGGARQSDRHDRGADRRAQPRPGPRDELRADRVGALRRADRERLDRARRHRQGAVRHGHLRLAHRPVSMSAIVKALDKVEAKAKKIAAHLMEASEGDIEINERRGDASPAPTRSSPGSRCASPPTRRTTCRRAWSRA